MDQQPGTRRPRWQNDVTGMLVGVAMGAGLGFWNGEPELWIPLGIIFGAAIGETMESRKR